MSVRAYERGNGWQSGCEFPLRVGLGCVHDIDPLLSEVGMPWIMPERVLKCWH